MLGGRRERDDFRFVAEAQHQSGPVSLGSKSRQLPQFLIEDVKVFIFRNFYSRRAGPNATLRLRTASAKWYSAKWYYVLESERA